MTATTDPDSTALPPCTLTLIVPCYNEEATIVRCVDRILRLRSNKLKLEIIIVDDGSSDDSLSVAGKLEKSIPEVRLIGHGVNRGKGAALRTGFQEATGDFVGIQDADLEYEPLDYLKLMAPLMADKADVVFGSRYLQQDERKVLYFWHSWMNRTLTSISNMMTNLDITDMETCYKLFRRETIQSLELKENRFGIEPEIVAKVAENGYRVWEVAISYEPRSYEEGKKITWKDGISALYSILHYSAHKAQIPMQLLIYLFIGGVSAVANMVAFIALLALDLGVARAAILAYIAAAAINYLLCIAILFRHKARWSTWSELAFYLLTVSIMGGLDLLITVGFTGMDRSPYLGKALAIAFGFVGNFVLRKYLVFPERIFKEGRR